MKKLLCIFGIILIIFAQNAIGINYKMNQGKDEILDTFSEKKIIQKDPPAWATGEFNGTWGISIAGLPAVELGWVEGYFDAFGILGRLEGDFAVSENEEPTAYINGFIIGFFMLGSVGDYVNPSNSTLFVGLGAPNENGTFYYNIHLFVGPSWYMQGDWKPI